ncbi:hypothetical protein HI914_03768 [Erysiphe necator]|nr:hypothetical protein HI914_03768 [Erysiphe necator]
MIEHDDKIHTVNPPTLPNNKPKKSSRESNLLHLPKLEDRQLNRKHENVSITDSDRATKTTGEDYKAPKHESKEPLLQVEHENLHKVYAQTPKDVPQDKPLPTKCHDLQSSQTQNQDTMPHKSETQTLLEINPNKQESDIELKVSLATPHASPNLISSVPEL